MSHLRVASFTDAWIETNYTIIPSEERQSHLLQMRGLKHWTEWSCCYSFVVASFTDAWIETIGAGRRQKRAMSHLLQMRGLKQKMAKITFKGNVASFTDAWIET